MALKPTYKKGLNVDYNPQALKKVSEKELRAEYARLKKITKRRVERLQRSEFDMSTPALIGGRLVKNLNKKYKKQLSRDTIAARIAEMSKFLEYKGSTIKGARDIRRETREKLEETLDYKFKNYKQFRYFGYFMDYLRAMYKDNFHYLMDDVVDLFNDFADELESKSLTFEEFVQTYETRYKTQPVVWERPTRFK